jgi:hypothetical protein
MPVADRERASQPIAGLQPSVRIQIVVGKKPATLEGADEREARRIDAAHDATLHE